MVTDNIENHLAIDELDSPEYARLLGVIDAFRALGISKEISLPQVSGSQTLTVLQC